MAVSPIGAVNNVLNGKAAGTASVSEGSAQFKDFLTQAIDQAELTSADDQAYTDALLIGELNNLHDAPIAARKAELAISLTVQIRDRLVDAYTEIMRMQV
ncbi:Flagellar hook-basal body complex protein FliE [bioreactor metagenome]|uniref:Flagellar hook-basal body complex protein FliE n=1 Tax=bioreactor metagenome TaxID=1076179 RepID=A0A645IKW1_9ZZZZ|nr:flagellar hook-basal body complex protein FliE [Candidatus Pelethousia sp.]NCB31489.1 flagellar hook-basal body complex protein FliE [Clostridia bacterium]